ncbi:MAG: PTS sugar transporter subunit IIB, partial [Clostridiales bacterium]|nr:PTS sugar transporter subunit IIB [Clostridiales bacterium]
MSVVFYRIDDRLIHGQVMTGWSKKYNADRIIVVDDASAANSFLVQVMMMSVPKGMEVKVCAEKDGIETVLNDDPAKRTIVLTKTPASMLALV